MCEQDVESVVNQYSKAEKAVSLPIAPLTTPQSYEEEINSMAEEAGELDLNVRRPASCTCAVLKVPQTCVPGKLRRSQ